MGRSGFPRQILADALVNDPTVAASTKLAGALSPTVSGSRLA